VLLWLTTAVERDFEERGAFPELRYASSRAYRGAATLHCLSADEADLVLEDASARPGDMDVPSYRFHPLKGERAGEYAVSVSDNWRITFAFDGEDAIDVNLEDYH